MHNVARVTAHLRRRPRRARRARASNAAASRSSRAWRRAGRARRAWRLVARVALHRRQRRSRVGRQHAPRARGRARLRRVPAPAGRSAGAAAGGDDPRLSRDAAAAASSSRTRAAIAIRWDARPRAGRDRRPRWRIARSPTRCSRCIARAPCPSASRTTTPSSTTCCSTRGPATALCVVDLDTVMPGLAPYDFGDLVRSCAARERGPARSERRASRPRAVRGAPARLPRRYGRHAHRGRARRPPVRVQGHRVRAGMRFLTDYLAGDVYFKTARPNTTWSARACSSRCWRRSSARKRAMQESRRERFALRRSAQPR